ncbi:MAG: outer membrane lipid asymmetry maintenance protein MlaD [Deltaproteobacteria bacterium]|nr:outer membrane lipid asymmetry maintenance protein MlaD [Deltaproteobacteria bacterium]MBW2414126.1 outer membrane lipid asymmetry maintenance protein MlaD [Deltaproteobacteria bacterium]
MTNTTIRDLVVGLFVAVGMVAIAYMSFSLGGLSYAGPGGLQIFATFNEIGGLNKRAPVVIGGVKVGQVTRIALDDEYYARIEMDLDARLNLPDDSSAAILTRGLLGNQFISIEPGASEDLLEPGAEISLTEDAVIMERLIGRVISNLGGDGS